MMKAEILVKLSHLDKSEQVAISPCDDGWMKQLTKSLELFALPPPILCRSSMLSSKRIGSTCLEVKI